MKINPKVLSQLPKIQRPGRYAGQEINSALKPDAPFRMGICYPDLYEIGMGNLAMKILYQIVNDHPSWACERVFAVAKDMEEFLKQNQIPLYTLENYTPLYQLDILGFTIPYELVYTNILSILELGQIPLFSQERNEKHPFVIGGGPAMSNPEPMADFFDGFLIGEGETAMAEIIAVVENAKKQGAKRSETLKKLSEIKGFYVPSLVPVEYEENNFYLKNSPEKIAKRVESDLNAVPSPTRFPIPWLKIAHNKGMVEVFRGCYHRCRYCQAGTYYKPVRERNPEKIQEAVRDLFYTTGEREFSLLSLSSGDYSLLPELMSNLNQEWKDNFVSFYLPSLKVNTFDLDLIEGLNAVRKSGITLAVETGSEKIRNQMNKDVSDEKLFEIVKMAEQKGWNLIKLYFMIGLTENLDEEKESIIKLLKNLSYANRRVSFNVNVGMFIPKPGTPFQWKKLYDYQTIDAKLRELIHGFHGNRKIKIKFQLPSMSFIEGILARGSRMLSKAILESYRSGSRFDSWDDSFNLSLWLNALEKTQNQFDYKMLENNLKTEKILPWNFLDCGVSNEFLLKEQKLSETESFSGSCVESCPDYCGACKPGIKPKKAEKIFSSHLMEPIFKTSKDYKTTVCLVFAKDGPLRFVSQLELVGWWEKLLIKSRLPILFTEGFNPRPKIEFGFTPSVGIASLYENIRFQIGANVPEQEIYVRLAEILAPASKIMGFKLLEKRPASLQSVTFYQDLFIKKSFISDEKLLFLIKEKYKVLQENETDLIFRLPIADKIKQFEDKCDIFEIKRLKLLTKDEEEVF